MAENQDIVDAIQQLQQIMNQRTGSGSSDDKKMKEMQKTIERLTKKLKDAGEATDEDTEATKEGTGSTRRFAGAIGGTVKNIGAFATATISAGVAVQENQESFSSLNSSIDIAAGLLKTTGKVAGGLTDSFGEALKGIPVVGGLIGGVVSGIGQATAAVAEAAADFGAQIGKQVTSQLDAASTAFRTVAQSGGLGAQGMQSVGEQAIGAGLSFKDFADVTKNSTEGLAFAFGSASGGVERFAQASKAMIPFRRELELLGIGGKQQNEMTANYLKLQSRTARIENMSSQELAQGSANYIKELTTLSRLTGQSVSETEKQQQAQLRNARFNGAVQQANADMGKNVGKAMQDTSTLVSAQNAEIGKGLQDLLAGNALTDESQGFILAAGAKGQEAVALLQKGEIDSQNAYRMIQEGMKERVEAMGGPGALAKIVGAGTAFDNIATGMLNANTQVIPTAESIKELKNQTLAATQQQDATTKGLVDGQMQMRAFATEVNKLSLTAMPAMGSAVTTLTTSMLDAITEIQKMTNMGAEAYARDKLGIKDPETIETGDIATAGLAGAAGGALAGAAAGAALGLIGGPLAPITSSLGAIAGALIGGIGGGLGMGSAASQGLLPDWLDFDWGGGKAVGGDIKPRTAYMVGEQGPELLLSNMSGTVVPNAGPAGGYNSMGLGGPSAAGAGGAGGAYGMPGAGGSGGGIGDAQINRLDQLIEQMVRNNRTSEQLLQAAHR